MEDIIVSEPTVATTGRQKLPKEAVMQLENHQLKVQNIQLKLQLMNNDLQKTLAARDQLFKEMEDFRASLLDTFGVDVAMTHVDPDGTVRPLDPQEIQMLAKQRGM